MTKTEIVEVIWEDIPMFYRSKMQKKWVKHVVDKVFETILEASIVGETVSIKKFGTFTVSPWGSRRIYSQYAGGWTKTKDTYRVRFKPGTYWKGLLKGSAE